MIFESFFRRLFSSNPRKRNRKPGGGPGNAGAGRTGPASRHRRSLSVEPLEQRQMLASIDIELSSLLTANGGDGTAGFVLNGISSTDEAGFRVSSAGDFNGDEFDDIIVSAPFTDLGLEERAGQSFVVFGQAGGFPAEIELSSLTLAGGGDGSVGFVINGISEGDNAGYSVTSAGDLNGDGLSDLVIGAHGVDSSGASAGATYVLYGNTTGFGPEFNLITLLPIFGGNGSQGFVINGIDAYDNSGHAVNSAGDFNGDGFSDIIIGAKKADPNGLQSGEAYIVFGQDAGFGAELNLASLNSLSGMVINGISAEDRAGVSVSGAGDVNGDGFDDVVIGAYWRDYSGSYDVGEAYVVFGDETAFLPAQFNLSSLAGAGGTTGFVIRGNLQDDEMGVSVSGAGDVNSDGFDDVIVGANFADPNGLNSGQSYVVFGSATPMAVLWITTRDVRDGLIDVNRDGAYDVSDDITNFLGFGLNIIDGRVDVDSNGIIDALDDISNNTFFGFNVVDGGVDIDGNGALTTLDDGVLQTLFGPNGFAINGIDGADQSGYSVAGGGDINGDGFDDLIIGAHAADPNGNQSGEIYLVFGHDTFARTIELSSLSGVQFDGIQTADYAGYSVDFAGDINGDGFDDIIIGANFADPNGNSSGQAYVILGDPDFDNNGFVDFPAIPSPADPRMDFYLGAAGDDTFVGEPQQGFPFANTPPPTIVSADFIDVFVGGLDDDTMFSTSVGGFVFQEIAGHSDYFRGGEGDDVFDIANGIFMDDQGRWGRVNGNHGNDLLRLTNLNTVFYPPPAVPPPPFVIPLTLDLTAIPDNRIMNIEEIDISGNGVSGDLVINTLTLDQQEVINISDTSNTLIVRRNNDIVNFGEPICTPTSGSPCWEFIGGELIDKVYFNVYQQDAAILKVQDILTEFNLENLLPENGGNATVGFVINGIAVGDEAGYSVSSAGDVNDDGFDDILVGSNRADGGGTDRGEAYVVFGMATGFTAEFELSDLQIANGGDGSTGFVINGIVDGDRAGRSVSSAGDLNNDGIDDIIIGADQAISDDGQAYVIFGKSTPFAAEFDVEDLLIANGGDGSIGFVVHGAGNNDGAGFSVSDAGDVNGDGLNDLLVGAPGSGEEAYVIFGQLGGFAPEIDLDDLFAFNGGDGSTGFVIRGEAGGNNTGNSVSAAGDVNNDGFADVIVGAPRANGNRGRAYVVFGRATFGPEFNLSSLLTVNGGDGTQGFALNGIDATDEAGFSVSGAGDVNRDGFDDVIVGAPGAFRTVGLQTIEYGEAYVVFGAAGFGAEFALNSLNGANGFRLTGDIEFDRGSSFSDRAGQSVSGAGDFNGDGFDDVFVGAYLADPLLTDTRNMGQSYVIYGAAGGFPANINLSSLLVENGGDGLTGFALNGVAQDDQSGNSVSDAGDVNGDGFGDLLISGHLNDRNGDNAGQAYVMFGFDTRAEVTFVGEELPDVILGTPAADVIVSGLNTDTVTSAGGADVIYTAEGDDMVSVGDQGFARIAAGNGLDTLLVTGSVTIDLTTLADNRLTGFEVIDLRGAGTKTLILDPLEVANISDHSNRLIVHAEQTDVLHIGLGWTDGGTELVGGSTYQVFEQGAIELLVPMFMDFGDAPDPANGTATDDYNTRTDDDGPRHLVIPQLFIGGLVDEEIAASPHPTAQGDDIDGTDDEEGVASPVAALSVFWGSQAVVAVNVSNTTGSTATLYGWIDYNGDGIFDTASEGTSVAVGNGVVGAVNLTFPTVPVGSVTNTFARFRLSTDPNAASPTGAVANGEVEDYTASTLAPLQTTDYGDAPDSGPGGDSITNYETISGDNGPSHDLTTNNVLLGPTFDGEADGLQSVGAVGDDNAGDDENGLLNAGDLTQIMGDVPQIDFSVTNTSGIDATLYGWIDYDRDGQFELSERGEIVIPTGAVNATVTLVLPTVPIGAAGITYGRFRISTDGAAAMPTGPATDGEVEDYQFTLAPSPNVLDFADAPDIGAGVGNGDYYTLLQFGPRHNIVTRNIYLGDRVDGEPDGLPNATATGDDDDNLSDEDGVDPGQLFLPSGQVPVINVSVTNTSGANGFLYGWIDYNRNGNFEVTEQATAVVPDGTLDGIATLTFPAAPTSPSTINTYARFRFSTDMAAASSQQLAAPDGEVEDHAVVITSLDFGDAPLNADTGFGQDYPTEIGLDGARHGAIGPRLGLSRDTETNGQPDATATGDGPDEDGITLPATIVASTVGAGIGSIDVDLQNADPTSNFLDAWIDFNRDGDWDDPGEQILTSASLGTTDGIIPVTFPIPAVSGANIISGDSFARFRLSTAGGLSPTGGAVDGEVEDYQVTLSAEVVVTTEVDEDDGTADGSVGAGTSLREAISFTNANPGLTITFDPSLDTTPIAVTITGTNEDANINGDLDITSDVTIQGNGPANTIVDAGGAGALNERVFEVRGGAVVTFANMTITGGNAMGVAVDGGGIAIGLDASSPDVTIEDTVITQNFVPGGTGGGVHIESGSATVIGTTIHSNQSDSDGAGIFNAIPGILSITNTTISNNVSTDAFVSGVGIANDGVATITSSTIANNFAPGGFGGGVSNGGGTTTVTNTIIAGNIDAFGEPDVTGIGFISGDFNLIGDGSGPATFLGANDQVGTAGSPIDPLLGPLDDNGGPTPTHALVPNSPAIDAGSSLLTTDQRGNPRPVDENDTIYPDADNSADIGAYEGILLVDMGDAPDTGAGAATGNYNTLSNDDGPIHLIDPDIFLGVEVDGEDEAFQSANADGDDTNGPSADDEDGLVTFNDLTLIESEIPGVEFIATNNSGSAATLFGWIDYNNDGVFDNGTEQAMIGVPDGTTNGSFTLTFPAVPAGFTGTTFGRFRLSTDAAASDPTGVASDGEVEDYPVTITPLDFGDAPDSGDTGFASSYPTLLVDDGARHLPTTFTLGPDVDFAEGDGLPEASALGDDNDTGDDENGVTFNTPTLSATSTGTAAGSVDVEIAGFGATSILLDAWIDFNRDGDWDDTGEQIFTNFDLGTTAGTQTLPFTIPQITGTNVSAGDTFSRFRVSTGGGLTPTGASFDGEVEDHLVTIDTHVVVTTEIDEDDGNPDPTVGNGTSLREAVSYANANPGTLITFDVGLNGTPISMSIAGTGEDSNADGDFDLLTDVTIQGNGAANTIIDAAGIERIFDVGPPGAIQVEIVELSLTGGNQPVNFGGALLVQTGSAVTLRNTHLFGNSAAPGSASMGGGAIGNFGTLMIEGSTLSNNTGGVGGAINNHAVSSGLTMINSTIVGNMATGGTEGGGIFDNSDFGPTTLTNVTITGNTGGLGGGIWVDPGSTLIFRNTIIAGNTGTGGGPDGFNGTGGAVVSLGNNLVGDTTSFTFAPGPGDLTNLSAQLDPGGLDDHGGPTPTIALLPGSPAIDAGADVSGLGITTDQRGVGRPIDSPDSTYPNVDDGTDIGAFEGFIAADLGDAPDLALGAASGDYNTFSFDMGPIHVVDPLIFMGAFVDAEFEATPTAPADGDDLDSLPDDEDGILDPIFDLVLPIGSIPEVDVVVTNLTPGAAMLYGWIDYDSDGLFEPTEFASAPVAPGTAGTPVILTFPVVPAGFIGTTYARFRLSTDPAASMPIGPAADGEVEDHLATIVSVTDDSIGVFRTALFFLDANDSDTFDGVGGGDVLSAFGATSDIAIAGDWNSDGFDEIGVYRPSSSTFFLDTNGSGGFNAGDEIIGFGALGDIPIIGNWDGVPGDEIGVYRPSTGVFFKDVTGDGFFNLGDEFFGFGAIGDLPVIGDWNGDGTDEIGVYRPSTASFYLDVDDDGTFTGADTIAPFGATGDTPVAGDWNGDGTDNIGVFRSSTATFILDENGSLVFDAGDSTIGYGAVGDQPLAGNWASPIVASKGPAPESAEAVETIERGELKTIVRAAINVFAQAGLSADQIRSLRQVNVGIADLPGGQLAQASAGAITIDVNAAGYGWFVDDTPLRNEEFSSAGLSGLEAVGQSAAAGHMDLLTVVLHEFGHALGLGHNLSGNDPSDLMNGWLDTGVRRLPTEGELAALLAGE